MFKTYDHVTAEELLQYSLASKDANFLEFCDLANFVFSEWLVYNWGNLSSHITDLRYEPATYLPWGIFYFNICGFNFASIEGDPGCPQRTLNSLLSDMYLMQIVNNYS